MRSVAAFITLAFLVGTSVAFPVDVITGRAHGYWNYYDNYYQPCAGAIPCRTGWPGVGYGNVHGGVQLGSVWGAPLGFGADAAFAADYGYNGNIGFAQENFVRSYGYGPTEYGVRDEVTFRPGPLRVPYSRFYASYFPYNYFTGANIHPFTFSDYEVGFRGFPMDVGTGPIGRIFGGGWFKK